MSKYSNNEKKIFEALNNIQFEKDKDAELDEYRKSKKDSFYYKIIFVVTTVLVIGGICFYQYDQVKQNQTSILVATPRIDPLTQIPKRTKYTPKPQTTYSPKQAKCSPTNRAKVTPDKNGKIYYWTDNDGNFHATNTGIPDNIQSLNSFKEMDKFNKRTPIRIKGNSIYIPVTFYNNHQTVTTEMLLDTGCSTTLITKKVARKLKLENLKNSKSVVADGRIVSGYEAKTGYMKVGPHTEANIKVHYYRKSNNKTYGLLGMNFLKKHPFVIDTRNKMIIWE